MLLLKKTQISPMQYEGLVIRLRTVLSDVGKMDLSPREQEIFENLLLGISTLYDNRDYDGLLGEDQIKILWGVEEAVRSSGHKVDCETSKRRCVDHMFDDIAMRFVCHRENMAQVGPRVAAIKRKYIDVVQQLAAYHGLEGMRKVARKARFEVVDVLSVYDWHIAAASDELIKTA